MKNTTENISVLFILNHFYPEVGAIRTEYQLAQELSRLGDQVIVVTTYPREYRTPHALYKIWQKTYGKKRNVFCEKLGELLVYRVPSYIGKTDNIYSRLLEILSSIPLLLLVGFVALLKEKPDVIITGGDMESLVTLAAYPLKFISRKPILTIMHDIHSSVLVDLGLIKRNSLMHKLIKFLERILLAIVEIIVVHSPSNKDFLVKAYGKADKIQIIYLWADITRIRPIWDKNSCENKGKFVVYYGGVLSYAQAPEIIIEAAKIIEEKGYFDILFLIVGEGPEKRKIVELTRKYGLKNVIFRPFVPWEVHIKFLQCSDIGLVTLKKNYKQPVVPSKLIEIMSAGVVPLLAVPPHNDAKKIAVDTAKAGIWVEPENPAALAKAIISLYKDRILLNTLRKRARKFAEEYFSLKKNAEKYRKLLVKLVKKREI